MSAVGLGETGVVDGDVAAEGLAEAVGLVSGLVSGEFDAAWLGGVHATETNNRQATVVAKNPPLLTLP